MHQSCLPLHHITGFILHVANEAGVYTLLPWGQSLSASSPHHIVFSAIIMRRFESPGTGDKCVPFNFYIMISCIIKRVRLYTRVLVQVQTCLAMVHVHRRNG